MENGGGREREVVLAEKMSGLGLSDSSNNNYSHNNDSLFQVMKALEAAEATIKQQVEENTRLRNELQNNVHLLHKHKSDEPTAQTPHSLDTWKEQLQGPYNVQSVPSVDNQQDSFTKLVNNSRADPSGMLVLHQDLKSRNNDPTDAAQTHVESHSGISKVNGPSKVLPSGQESVDNSGLHRSSSPSSSVSPNRYLMEGEHHPLPRLNSSGDGHMQMAEVNNNGSLWKQDVFGKIREHEEEIMQLRRQLSDYSVKEAQVRNEKYVLEKRIAYMRLAFDQQQQDLVDAASKALSYRQDIIEENIRLTYELQATQQERSTFVSSLIPLLSEYNLQPPVLDAQSIVSNVKILFRHLQEKLILTESKLKESQYQLAPWRSDVNHSNYAPQSPSHSIGAALTTMNKNGLELVPQHAYSHGKIPMTSSDTQPAGSWDLPSHQESGLGSNVTKNLDEEGGRYSPLASRNSSVHDAPTQFAVTRGDTQTVRYAEETANKQVIFRDPVSSSDMDDFETEGHQNDRESSAQWGPGNSHYSASLDDPNSSYSPYLPPVLEEPSSSFSEAADDDPLPGIEGLQISGEAFPGRELQACGYSTNGTTSCNFEWVRHLEDGSVNYIEGAKQPNYLVTADDVDTYLAIEVQPLDDRKRKGELVKVFANEHKKIKCDHEMLNHIQKTLYTGHVSFKVSLSTGYIDIWESATLAIKREGYSIKCSGPSGGVVTEKFSPATSVTIPYGHATEFIVVDSSGHQHHLQADSSEDISCSRDTIVLTLRLFIKQFGERRKGKRRGIIFFNK